MPDRARWRRGVGGAGLDLAALADGTPLDVEADLHLEVVTPAGETTTAHITGNGAEIIVDVERPDLLLSMVDRRDVGRVADLLAASGITARVMGPDGPAAVVGATASSRLGLAATGSSRVAPAPGAAARLVAGRLSPRSRSPRTQAVTATVVVAAVLAAVAAAVASVRRGRS